MVIRFDFSNLEEASKICTAVSEFCDRRALHGRVLPAEDHEALLNQ
jgi:hypothetical protein